MGGFGSGRRYGSGKHTTSSKLELDVRRLHREGLLAPGQSIDWRWLFTSGKEASIHIRSDLGRLILNYHHRCDDGPWQVVEETVYLEWTGLHFGGGRPWFRCPKLNCGRRVAKLFGAECFACRHCQRLAYECQRENLEDRATRQAAKIRKKLEWVTNGDRAKPKGMHWRTYERLKAAHDAYIKAAWDEKMKRDEWADQVFERLLAFERALTT